MGNKMADANDCACSFQGMITRRTRRRCSSSAPNTTRDRFTAWPGVRPAISSPPAATTRRSNLCASTPTRAIWTVRSSSKNFEPRFFNSYCMTVPSFPGSVSLYFILCGALLNCLDLERFLATFSGFSLHFHQQN